MSYHALWALLITFTLAVPLRAEMTPLAKSPLANAAGPIKDHYRLASLWGQTQPPPARQTPHPAVVRVIAVDRNSMSLGSGTLVDANEQYGLVITNWHVVRDAVGPIEVLFPDGFHSMAQVVRTDREWDLAALLIWKPPVQPVPISATAPRPGEPLSIAGYGSGNYLMQSGLCTEYLSPAPGRPLEIVEVSAAARHGDSGGPILNSRGEIAGVLFGEGGGRTDGSYCGRVHKFLETTSVDLQRLPTSNIAAMKPLPQIGAVAQNISPGASARFDGGISAPAETPAAATGAWTETISPRVADRTAVPNTTGANDSAARPLAMAAPTQATTAASPALRATGAWTGWKGELKSLLAAIGVAAIVLQLLPRDDTPRNRSGRRK